MSEDLTPRYTTRRLQDEIAKAREYGRQEAADAIAAKDREIAELRADCVRKDEHLLAAVQDYNGVRQRTIEECAKVADDYQLSGHPNLSPGSEINAWWSGQEYAAQQIAAAIRSLGKEGSGEC